MPFYKKTTTNKGIKGGGGEGGYGFNVIYRITVRFKQLSTNQLNPETVLFLVN